MDCTVQTHINYHDGPLVCTILIIIMDCTVDTHKLSQQTACLHYVNYHDGPLVHTHINYHGRLLVHTVVRSWGYETIFLFDGNVGPPECIFIAPLTPN